MEPDYYAERKQYQRGLEVQRDAAVDACEKALRSIGVHVTDRLREALWQAMEQL